MKNIYLLLVLKYHLCINTNRAKHKKNYFIATNTDKKT